MGKKFYFHFFLVFFSSALAVGCTLRFEIDLVEPAQIPSPQFTIRDPRKPNETPSFHTLEVFNSQRQQVWKIQTPDLKKGYGANRIAYGQSLEGFETLISALPLKSNENYTLAIYGTPTGVLHFKVHSDGTIQRVQSVNY